MATATTQVKILVPGHQSMVTLLGQRDAFLKQIEVAFPADVLVRGNEITITGPPETTEQVGRVFEELLELLEQGYELTEDTVRQTISMVTGAAIGDLGDEEETPRPSEVLGDNLLSARGKKIAPKTFGQKRYTDAIRRSTVTFAIGPAGTGKTYLAVAVAVRALQERQISRIILTRPAVEAGERLGFLPGTLYEKIDPYMRPLYDALYEMTGPDTLPRLMERGIVEVAPLAFMRGRTLNEARRRVREALSLVIGDDAFSISLAERVVLPAGARRELTRQKRPADAPKTRPGERWKPPELPLVR